MPIVNDMAFSSAAPLSATTASTTASTTPTASATNASGLGSLTSSDFLQLLVAQITNQDPLNPVSSSQFMSQTAELSTLEQITALSQSTAQASAAEQSGAAIDTIGKTVAGVSEAGKTVTGKVTGVEETSDGPLLEVGGALVAFSNLASVT